MNRSNLLVLLLCTAIFSACATANFINTGPVMPPRPDDCEIEIFTSKLPDRDYDEIGVIEGEGSFGADSLSDILPKMKTQACKAGGDAIIMTSSERSSSYDGDESLFTTATVVVWVD